MHYCTRLEHTSPTVSAHHNSRTCSGLLPHQVSSERCISSLLPPSQTEESSHPHPPFQPHTQALLGHSQPLFLGWVHSPVSLQETWDKKKSSPKVLLLTCPPFSFPCRDHLRRLLKKPTPIFKVTSVAEILLSPPSRPPHYCWCNWTTAQRKKKQFPKAVPKTASLAVFSHRFG